MKKIVLLFLSIASLGLAHAEPLPLNKRVYISGEFMQINATVHTTVGSPRNDTFRHDGKMVRLGYHVADQLSIEGFGWQGEESKDASPFDRLEGIGGGIRYGGWVTDSLMVTGFAGYGQSKFDFNGVERKINGASFGAGLSYYFSPGFSINFDMQSYADDDDKGTDFTLRGYSYGLKISMVLGGGKSSGGGDDDDEEGDEDEDEEGGDDEDEDGGDEDEDEEEDEDEDDE